MIGWSLSFCISDIMRGDVRAEDVAFIYASTRCHTDGEFEEVLEQYAAVYWRKWPEEAKALARKFWLTGRILQPRLSGMEAHNISRGHWSGDRLVA